MWTEERRKHFSESRKGINNPFYGKTHSIEHRKKIAESHTGINNKTWKGDDVCINALHIWVKRHFWKPRLCQKCLLVPPYDLANITNIYKRDFKNWRYYCRRCHLLSDGRMFNNLKQFK
jgi:hypothetical protein